MDDQVVYVVRVQRAVKGGHSVTPGYGGFQQAADQNGFSCAVITFDNVALFKAADYCIQVAD
ncbi:MAG: hypothetical protein BWY65_02198 [Firmicutes bacterium ADurb.Bin373]|nr:MAG: hypothetical protein BWY65_02198 [Firmicutes bacterium ADurb.Bin373]